MTAIDTERRVEAAGLRSGNCQLAPRNESGNPLLNKLAHFSGFNPACAPTVDRLFRRTAIVPRHRDILSEGSQADEIVLLLRGWAARYKLAHDGERQILSFLLPGDVFPSHPLPVGVIDYGILALTRCTIKTATAEAFDHAVLRDADLARAFWWLSIQDKAILRAWLVNLGTRSAYARIANLFCELAARLRLAGVIDGWVFDLAPTQEELADAEGLTAVHTNRTLQQLRTDGLIKLDKRRLTILDSARLQRAGDFDPAYLNPGGRAPIHLF